MTTDPGERPTQAPFSSIEEIIEDLRRGKMVVILDDEERENEGDLICAAEFVTAETINFMATHGRGLICMPMTPERLDELQIPMMVQENTARRGTAFCVSIEARQQITTGISAADRARTVQVAVNPDSRPGDLASPGHVFPLRAAAGGVLKRTGHTEASVDLCRMGGLKPSAVICEIMNADGTMARLPQLTRFSKEHGIKMATIAELIRYRMRTERLVQRVQTVRKRTRLGECDIHWFRSNLEDRTHLALVKGELDPETPTYVRVHIADPIEDVFSAAEDSQLNLAMDALAKVDNGVVLYLRPALTSEPEVPRVVDGEEGPARHGDREEPDHRDYGIGAQILHELGVRKLRLLTNSEGRYVGLNGYGIEIVDRVPLHSRSSREQTG